MGAHINEDGQFQSDKYPTCPAGKVPLSVKDKTAQDLLWQYAQRRRPIDAEFSDDLESALKAAGYLPHGVIANCQKCGRGFFSLGAKCDMIDHYRPQPGSGVEPNAEGECGGTIKIHT